jgi:hypothetical protein
VLSNKKKLLKSQVWWYVFVSPAVRRLRQEGDEFKASLSYVVRPCLEEGGGGGKD